MTGDQGAVMAERRLPGEGLVGEVAAAVVRQLDLDEVIARVDLDAALARVDLDAVVARIDLDAAIGRIDLDAVVDQLDVDELVQRIVERAVVTGAVQSAIDRVDLGPALERAGLADIVAGSVGRTTLDTVRRRVVVFDALFERITGTVLRQGIDAWPAGPARLVGDEQGPLGDLDGTTDRGGAGWNVAGHYVGPLGRALATTADIAGAVSSWSLVVTVFLSLTARLFGLEIDLNQTQSGIGFAIGLALWIGAWFLLPLEVIGRTPAMGLLGMRVVDREGEIPTFPQLLVRSLVQIPSVLLLGVGYLVTLFDRRRRTLHDLVARTSVVWDWGDRAATIASPLGRWVARQPAAEQLPVDPPDGA